MNSTPTAQEPSVHHPTHLAHLATAIVPQLSARDRVRAAMGEAGASRKKRRSSTGTSGGGGARCRVLVRRKALCRRGCPRSATGSPCSPFARRRRPGALTSSPAPGGCRPCCSRRCGAMEVSGIFKSTVSLPRVVAVLRSFASGGGMPRRGCNHRAGGVHRAAAGEFGSGGNRRSPLASCAFFLLP